MVKMCFSAGVLIVSSLLGLVLKATGTCNSVELGFTQGEYTVNEDAGTIQLCVQACGDIQQPINVGLLLADGTATSGIDYVNSGGSLLVFSANGVTTQCVSVQIYDDPTAECDETFSASLSTSASRVCITPGITTITIRDDDSTYVGLSQDIYYVDENSGMVDVCVDVLQSPSFPVDVGLGTAPVTATGGTDYDDQPIPVLHLSSVGSMCASIDITTDILPEECTEEFRVSIIDVSSQSGICLLQDTATVVINDDDAQFGFTQDTYIISESAGSVVVGLELTGVPVPPFSASVASYENSASAGSDYANAYGTFVFTGAGTQYFTVPMITTDTEPECKEIFLVVVDTDSTVVCISRDQANVIIEDDDSYEMRLSQGSYTVAEGGGQVVVCVELVRHSLPASTAVVILSTSDGKATAGADYSAVNEQLTFLFDVAVPAVQCVSIFITGDSTPECEETFSVSLTSNDQAACITHGTAMITIVDDD